MASFGGDGYCRRFMRSSVRPSACPLSVYLSVRPEQRYRLNSFRISVIGLKFGLMMHSTMEQLRYLK